MFVIKTNVYFSTEFANQFSTANNLLSKTRSATRRSAEEKNEGWNFLLIVVTCTGCSSSVLHTCIALSIWTIYFLDYRVLSNDF